MIEPVPRAGRTASSAGLWDRNPLDDQEGLEHTLEIHVASGHDPTVGWLCTMIHRRTGRTMEDHSLSRRTRLNPETLWITHPQGHGPLMGQKLRDYGIHQGGDNQVAIHPKHQCGCRRERCGHEGPCHQPAAIAGRCWDCPPPASVVMESEQEDWAAWQCPSCGERQWHEGHRGSPSCQQAQRRQQGSREVDVQSDFPGIPALQGAGWYPP